MAKPKLIAVRKNAKRIGENYLKHIEKFNQKVGKRSTRNMINNLKVLKPKPRLMLLEAAAGSMITKISNLGGNRGQIILDHVHAFLKDKYETKCFNPDKIIHPLTEIVPKADNPEGANSDHIRDQQIYLQCLADTMEMLAAMRSTEMYMRNMYKEKYIEVAAMDGDLFFPGGPCAHAAYVIRGVINHGVYIGDAAAQIQENLEE